MPFLIRAGKRLPVTATEVVVELKRPPQVVVDEALPPGSNYVRFRLGPKRVAIAIGVRSKLPGTALVGRDLELYCSNEQDDAMDAYERLIGDAMRGDAALFARQDAVEAAWCIVEPVLSDTVPVAEYEPGSWGPPQADALIAPFGRLARAGGRSRGRKLPAVAKGSGNKSTPNARAAVDAWRAATAGAGSPHTLAIDIGGTHRQGVGARSRRRSRSRRVERADAASFAARRRYSRCCRALARVAARVRSHFGGVSRRRSATAASSRRPTWGPGAGSGFPLAAELEKRLGKRARVLNDAEVQGLGVIAGRGLECVLTLGTGMGSAIYRDGDLMPHLELGQHPAWKSKTYDQYVGARPRCRN